ncbi:MULTISPECIES: GntR family transcriptional regulator [unclassified Kineosporia]|uniref:GntR family transcriptional regulator n=1 Tax=unclassified Kineosporia TaxID=2626061 RepID=UPI0018E91ABA|nr:MULTISPECIES: GntR family transcriptional regulator [unclassified Kineosporia]
MSVPDGVAAMLPVLPVRGTMRDQVADSLRAAVVAGQMAPGEVYSAPALAERFGVSATPVREALLDLVRDGLMEPVRNKGFRVTALSSAELDATGDVRALLEPEAAARAARRPEAERRAAVERLRPVARRIVEAARSGDVVGHVRADREFHAGLLELTGNPVLAETVMRLRDRSRLYGLPRLAERGTLSDTAREHDTILDLVAAGDAEAAAAAMRHHVGHVRGEWSG